MNPLSNPAPELDLSIDRNVVDEPATIEDLFVMFHPKHRLKRGCAYTESEFLSFFNNRLILLKSASAS